MIIDQIFLKINYSWINKNDSKWNIRKETHIALFIIIQFNDNQNCNIFYAFYWMKGNVVNINLLKIPKIFIERLE